ncbi:MAG: AAA family ATPase [Desulfovibrionaceae bacterium]|nr:AAA family ATPase [Desulfovibrionaceae bacterium]
MSEKNEKQSGTGESFCKVTLGNEPLCKASQDSKPFREIRESGSIYVDKTTFAESLLDWCPPKASIILHPHGFGKTLNLSMLRDFCDIRQDSRAIFEGLAISQNKEVCDKWMNQYPVVLVSFREVGGDSTEQAMKTMASAIGTACREFAFLTDSEAVYETDRQEIRELMEEQADRVLLSDSLYQLSRALHKHFGKRAIVLIDDYDVPLLRARQNGYYKEMADFLNSLYGATMTDSHCFEFGVLTGCLPYTNPSMFGGFDNFVEDGMSDVVLADKFGFTSEEVDALLAQTGFIAKKDEIQEWYKGYLMGRDTEVFCPRDIMAYIAALQDNPDAKPEQNLCSPAEVEFIRKAAEDMTDYSASVTEDLLAGGCINFGIDEK